MTLDDGRSPAARAEMEAANRAQHALDRADEYVEVCLRNAAESEWATQQKWERIYAAMAADPLVAMPAHEDRTDRRCFSVDGEAGEAQRVDP